MNAQKNQETNYYEMMNMPKVIINKKLTAYTISYIEVKNGVKSELKMNNPNVNNPFYLSIISNEESGKFIINNKNQTEDTLINFSYIYKEKNDNETTYHFLTNDRKNNLTYILRKGENDIVILELLDDNNNGITLLYTISKI